MYHNKTRIKSSINNVSAKKWKQRFLVKKGKTAKYKSIQPNNKQYTFIKNVYNACQNKCQVTRVQLTILPANSATVAKAFYWLFYRCDYYIIYFKFQNVFHRLNHFIIICALTKDNYHKLSALWVIKRSKIKNLQVRRGRDVSLIAYTANWQTSATGKKGSVTTCER